MSFPTEVSDTALFRLQSFTETGALQLVPLDPFENALNILGPHDGILPGSRNLSELAATSQNLSELLWP